MAVKLIEIAHDPATPDEMTIHFQAHHATFAKAVKNGLDSSLNGFNFAYKLCDIQKSTPRDGLSVFVVNGPRDCVIAVSRALVRN
jgi:hypothetical protein